MTFTHFLNGRLVGEEELLISPLDLGYSRGFAAFEFMITSNGRAFMMDRHLDRLYNSCRAISLSLPWSREQIASWILTTIEANQPTDKEIVLRMIISGGKSGGLAQAETPTIAIIVEYRMPGPQEDYANGVHVLLSEFQRYEPQAKTTNYQEAIRLMSEAPSDIHEIIYWSDGLIREGTRCNIFALIDGKLSTPKTKILEGITRGVILNNLNLSVQTEARDFTLEELMGASEVFITAIGKEVMPVVRINSKPVGEGLVGDVTKECMRKFKNFFETYKY